MLLKLEKGLDQMVIDKIENLKKYSSLIKDTDKIAAYLQSADMNTIEAGKYPLPKTDCMVQIQRYTTKLPGEGHWESHRRYMDIQCMMQGRESVGWIPAEALVSDGGYQAEKDVELYRTNQNGCHFTLSEGWFALFLPEDGHMPCCSISQPSAVQKILFKVPVDEE